MVINDDDVRYGKAHIEIRDPLNQPTQVLKFGDKFYISAEGDTQRTGGRKLIEIYAKVFTAPQNPYPSGEIGKQGAIEHKNQIKWCFFSSKNVHNYSPIQGLIEVSDPDKAPIQYLYVWGRLEDHTAINADGEVTMQLFISNATQSGDVEP